jgi:hypothetical protein
LGGVFGGDLGGDLVGDWVGDLGGDLVGDLGGNLGGDALWRCPGDTRGMPKVKLKTHLKKIMLSLSLYCHVFSVGM